MHIPDGFLDPAWIGLSFLASAGYGLIALRRSASRVNGDVAGWAAAVAAGVFAAQTLNWPLPGGTSLHFVGSGLTGILFGPYLGFLVMAIVILVQAFVFHDGGITALGANVLNMAVIGVAVSSVVFRLLYSRMSGGRLAAAAAAFPASWLGFVLSGAAAGVEIGLSPSFPYGIAVTVPVMLFWHGILGVIEAGITSALVYRLYGRVPMGPGWEG